MAAPLTAVVLSPGLLQQGRVECSFDSTTVKVSDQGKERIFTASVCMGPQEIAASSEMLVAQLDWGKKSIGFVTYGPRDSGKSSLLFAEGGLIDVLLTRMLDQGDSLALSMSEVVYSESASTEIWQDLLNPDNTALHQVHIEVKSMSEAKSVLEQAKSRSETWVSGVLRASRGHVLIDIAVLGETPGHVYVLDLAGFQPAKLSGDLREKLPGEQQLMYTRMGLLQLRAYCRNLSEGKERESNHRFKVISLFERVLASAQLMFLICLRVDCAFGDACSALELLEVVTNLPRLTLDFVPLSIRSFPDFRTSDSSDKAYESPLKTLPTSQTILSQSKEEEEDPQDWLSAFDARLSHLHARKESKVQSKSVSNVSGLRLESEGFEEERTMELKELREQCVALRNVTDTNEEEAKALTRHISRLQEELETARQDTGAQLDRLKSENETLACSLEELSEGKGAKQLQDVFHEDFQALEAMQTLQNEQISMVRRLYETQPSERIQIRQLASLQTDLNTEVKRAENELKSLQPMLRKWDMAEKCHNNVKHHLHSLEGDLVSLEEKLSKQESKSQRLMLEIEQERAKAAELAKQKLNAQAETTKLTLASAHQRHVVVLKSSPNLSISTTAGSGSLVKDIRELQDGLRSTGTMSQLPAACQLMEHAKSLIDELRKAKIRVKNLSTKVRKLRPGEKTKKVMSSNTSANSSFARLPKFSFS